MEKAKRMNELVLGLHVLCTATLDSQPRSIADSKEERKRRGERKKSSLSHGLGTKPPGLLASICQSERTFTHTQTSWR